ncbi:MAG: hypothetical protein J0J01_18285 [Reyranella sp.]|uniref:DUF6036 family nucleotidyltransferase n=1 Tax=Reyranella sp. TaxID=1929291 RepID=UPI001AC9A5B6|nr:DUF6036 family nucleotidyltransferase [Reyranella sp.]MBN9088859.1 hypothetical protein [Reyranella sp.]
MKKQQLDHILRAAGTITGQKQFVIVGSQALHGKYPDLADTIVMSAEVDLFAPRQPDATELLSEIGVDSPFHATYGFYADPVDEATAVLPKGWKGRLVNLPAGDTGGVRGLCLEPHGLAISKYAARRDKDKAFTRQLARRGLVDRETLLALVEQTPISAEIKERIRGYIESDFASVPAR